VIHRSAVTLALAAIVSPSIAIAQVTAAPQLGAMPSTRATAVVTLRPPRGVQGVPEQRIRIDYGQPHLRGRTLHTEELVPLDSVWRLGANEATELETGVDLIIGGQAVPKGKYTLFALPAANGSWKLIINKNTGQWGTEYSAQHDLTRVDLRRRTLPSPIESFSIWLIPTAQAGGARSGELRFAWGTTELATNWSIR
jgi:hypothetical protein